MLFIEWTCAGAMARGFRPSEIAGSDERDSADTSVARKRD
jgi:hypothetical protein